MSAVRSMFDQFAATPAACEASGACVRKPQLPIDTSAVVKSNAPTSAMAAATIDVHPYTLPTDANPRELGHVRFHRSLDDASVSGKPIFIQFQEIPGCHTCWTYGDGVLRDPLVVELLETVFAPCAIHNNSTLDHDIAALAQFREPAWNNPVVHVVHPSTHSNLVPRIDGVYDLRGVARRVLPALIGHGVPIWVDYLAAVHGLRLVRDANDACVVTAVHDTDLRVATFVMECYWAGETVLGGLAGVVSTLPGWCDGVEIVEVEYDATVVTYTELARAAIAAGLEPMVHDESQRLGVESLASLVAVRDRREFGGNLKPLKAVSNSETKYHLKKKFPAVALLPLTAWQESHANSIAGRKQSLDVIASLVLTPRQASLVHRIDAAGVAAIASRVDQHASAVDQWTALLSAVDGA
ncbi:Aste57867_8997 [Aphanomyces stellatus]|uniref:Aste57867_8997 protein n=1 Tax=Aphanomyces stellatus TaxID=120398 RepID=A0A485KLX4_9STRA|nr:hypothetical protein As57867_008962 [Aphanomyces stellatus]VFT85881.1 Aste57867_8997 [Aphanomyces stellatus]